MHLVRFIVNDSFLHNIFVLNRDHTILSVYSHISIYLRLLLIVETCAFSAKWIHLIALTYLETQSTHLIFHKLVMEVGPWAWILPNLFRNALKEFTTNI